MVIVLASTLALFAKPIIWAVTRLAEPFAEAIKVTGSQHPRLRVAFRDIGSRLHTYSASTMSLIKSEAVVPNAHLKAVPQENELVSMGAMFCANAFVVGLGLLLAPLGLVAWEQVFVSTLHSLFARH